ncbi:hypothetical protein FA15DRAFT_668831 [Coprinopsis marcescibilis]|uniref:GATA-type domain-containing protein n=1 Tax=Coprinopsis marcescibilis TaxID=230819 RepID=A0A5C3KXW7_COPMA|nr:hypothetical protein FA15DRAFT_668831 [Coprinopsis marcescibilis]
MGPRTLCNACGLVWAKLLKKRSKESKQGGTGKTAQGRSSNANAGNANASNSNNAGGGSNGMNVSMGSPRADSNDGESDFGDVSRDGRMDDGR